MRYIPALDGLRAVAVALVMLVHAQVPGLHGAYVGVDVFFVLSGFLITSILLTQLENHGEIRLREFYLRRFFRLMPALLAMLAVYVAVAPILWPGPDHNGEALLAALYLSDYARAFWMMPEYLSHTWSLSAEEHFYLIWPPLLAALVRHLRGERLLVALLALFAAATAWRWIALESGQSWIAVYYRFDTRTSGMLAGSALAAVIRVPRWRALVVARRYYIAGVVATALVVTQAKWFTPWALLYGITVVELASAAMIVALLGEPGRLSALLSHPLMIWFGQLSYGLYLWHYPIMRYLREAGGWPLALGLGVPLACAFAWLSAVTVERYGFWLRDRMPGRQNRSAAPATQP